VIILTVSVTLSILPNKYATQQKSNVEIIRSSGTPKPLVIKLEHAHPRKNTNEPADYTRLRDEKRCLFRGKGGQLPSLGIITIYDRVHQSI
jgi:hypothetical protein